MPAGFIPNSAAIQAMMRDPAGPVGVYVSQKTIQVDHLAKDFCPVDTGRLRSSINWRIEVDDRGVVGIVGASVEYAEFQEFGTRHQAGTPFLRPALAGALG